MQHGTNYVLKCHIPGCMHKTEIGGVMLNFNTENKQELLPKFVSRLKEGKHNIEGVLVVKMCKYSRYGMSGGELLLSTFDDNTFGPSLCFGLGGTAANYYDNTIENS